MAAWFAVEVVVVVKQLNFRSMIMYISVDQRLWVATA